MPAPGSVWAFGTWSDDAWAADTWADAEDAPVATGIARSGRYMHVRGTRVYRPWFALLSLLFPLN